MNNCVIELAQAGKKVELPTVAMHELPAKIGKRLWIGPREFVSSTQALLLTEWAVRVHSWQPSLPEPMPRGRKLVYRDSSVLVMAVIQVTWLMSYEEVVNYLRSHAPTAQAIEFSDV